MDKLRSLRSATVGAKYVLIQKNNSKEVLWYYLAMNTVFVFSKLRVIRSV